MAKPIAEQKDAVKVKRRGRKKDVKSESVSEAHIQPVGGGRVRRIVFDGHEPAVHEEVHTQREYVPRHQAPMPDIEFEIDNLGRIRRGDHPVRAGDRTRTETVYTTTSGSVRKAYQPTAYGRRQVIYTTKQRGDHQEQERFSPSVVDRLIEGVSLEPQVEVHREVKTTFIKRKRKVIEKVPIKSKADKKAAKAAKKGGKSTPAADFKPVSDSDYEPQCGALTKDGVQCRNSCRAGSKYCGSHKSYRPRTLDDAIAAKDTAPAHDVAEDTKPGEGNTKASPFQAQCAAYTKDSMQCKNSSRKSSKYCGSHKGYRAPSKAQLLEKMDTKPRWSQAKDTKPAVKTAGKKKR